MQGCNGPGSCVKGVATVLLAGLLLWGTTGCSSGDPSAEATGGPAAGSDGEVELTGTITVSAASSLSEVFPDLAAEFSRLHPGVEAVTNFGSSARLAAQVRGGAPADLVAFADLASVQVLAEAGLVDTDGEPFATNELVIVTKPGNPLGIDSPAALAGATDAIVSLCAAEAPCGIYSAELLERAGVSIASDRVTRAQNATATLGAVSEGDADAAIVYRTDAMAAGDRVEVIEVTPGDSPTAEYVIAAVSGSANEPAARAFIDFVLSDRGRAVLAEAGFGPPS